MPSTKIMTAMKLLWILALPLFPLIVMLDMAVSPSLIGAPITFRDSVRLTWREWRRLAGF